MGATHIGILACLALTACAYQPQPSYGGRGQEQRLAYPSEIERPIQLSELDRIKEIQRDLTGAEISALEPYRACANEQAKIKYSEYAKIHGPYNLPSPYDNNNHFISQIKAACMSTTILNVERERIKIEIFSIVTEAEERARSDLYNAADKENKIGYEREMAIYTDRFASCLKQHTRVIALSNQEAADIVAEAILASCDRELRFYGELADKYHQTNAGEELYSAMQPKLKSTVILMVMQARAAAQSIPAKRNSPSM